MSGHQTTETPRNASHTSHTHRASTHTHRALTHTHTYRAFRAKSVVIVRAGGGGGEGEEGLTFVLVNECKLLFGLFPSLAKNNPSFPSPCPIQEIQAGEDRLQ